MLEAHHLVVGHASGTRTRERPPLQPLLL